MQEATSGPDLSSGTGHWPTPGLKPWGQTSSFTQRQHLSLWREYEKLEGPPLNFPTGCYYSGGVSLHLDHRTMGPPTPRTVHSWGLLQPRKAPGTLLTREGIGVRWRTEHGLRTEALCPNPGSACSVWRQSPTQCVGHRAGPQAWAGSHRRLCEGQALCLLWMVISEVRLPTDTLKRVPWERF